MGLNHTVAGNVLDNIVIGLSWLGIIWEVREVKALDIEWEMGLTTTVEK
jgi:hypothetical protein